MVNQNLSSLFAQARSNRIDLDGPLFALLELPHTLKGLTIEFVSTESAFRQGLSIKVRGGIAQINQVSAGTFALWTDTAPKVVDVDLRWTKKARRALQLWNIWEINGITHAWLGNAAMRIDKQDEKSWLLHCSNGLGEPNFDDLVARIYQR